MEGIQDRRAPARLHRLKAERDGPEGKQRWILGRIVEIVGRRLLLRIPPRLVHIQNEIKEALYLLLIQRELFREALQLLQHLLILPAPPVLGDPHASKPLKPAHIQKMQIDVPVPKVTQGHQGTDPSISIIPVDQEGPVFISPPQQRIQLLTVHLQKRQQALQEREFLVGRGYALDPVAIKLKNFFFLREVHLGIPHVGALQNRQSKKIYKIVLTRG